MSRNFSHMPRRTSGTRRAKTGIKLTNEIAVLRASARSRRWIEAIELTMPPAVRDEGEAFAREAMVTVIDIRAGSIEGVVQTALQPTTPHPPTGAMQPSPQGALFNKNTATCKVTIHVPTHNDETWQDAVRSLATDGSAAASLLAGELPGDLDDLLARHGASLSPRGSEHVTMECNCGAPAPCVHMAAIVYVLADRLHEEPGIALVIRGLPAAQLIDRVRQVRTVAARRSANAADTSPSTEALADAPQLDVSCEEFWRTGPELEDLAQLPPPNHAAHALLRRLGPSPLGGTFPLVGLLASAYDTIKAHAEKLRDEADSKDD